MPNLRSINTETGAKRRLDSHAAASYLGVSHATLAKWRSIGSPHIPYSKAGRKVTYSVADLDAFIAKHRVDGPEAA
jgi:hypothetical protein